jgi:RecA/RadA recombinase
MDIIKKARKQLAKQPEPPDRCFLSTGCSLLNLACSGKVNGGFATGGYYLLVGDSSSGKSFLSLTCFAEAANNPGFDDYRLIYDDVEDGALMDKERFFGSKAAQRIEPPGVYKDRPNYSRTVEQFYENLDARCSQGPCIYVLDSMDALDTEDDLKKLKKQRSAKDGEAVSGSYGTSKAKRNSAGLRQAINSLQVHGSILLIISQTRDNIGPGAMFDPKTRGGGKAMRFYATVEMWTSIGERIRVVRANGKKEKVGIVSKVQVKKNRIQGREPVVNVRILDQHGIDDVGSSVAFLVDEGHWPEERKVITADDLGLKGKRERLIEQIQSEGMEQDLRLVVAEVWEAIEKECALVRKRRYE